MRKSFVLFITSLIAAVAALVIIIIIGHEVHQRSVNTLLDATDTLASDDPSIHLVDSALFTLNDAENNFRLYTVLYEKKHLEKFSRQINNVLNIIDTISNTLDSTYNNKQLNALIKQKEVVSRNIGRLKATTDSLLANAGKNDMVDKLISSIPDYSVKQIKKERVVVDTIDNSPKTQATKKSVFKRIGNALANKKDTVKSQISIVVRTADGKVIDKEAYDAMQLRKTINDINTYYKNIIRQQLSNRLKLNEEESSLAGTNIALMEELKMLLISLRERARAEAEARRMEAREVVTSSTQRMSRLEKAALGLILLCAGIITWNIIINRNRNRELKQQRQEARETTRVRTEFMNNMSHEMRTPLNAVIGFSEQLSFTPLNLEQKEIVHNISASSDLLLQVVNDVLDFSRLEKDYISITSQPFVVYQVFNEVVNMMRMLAVKKNLTFNASYEGDKNAQVNGDLFRLKQIMLNLISNAIKYTDHGAVTVTASLHEKDNTTSTFKFAVSDTGEGIAKEAIPHLFDRFFQAGSQIKGTGLGLAITKRLLVLQGGDITVESKLGKGSTFACEIPYTKVVAPLMMETTPKDVQETTGALMAGKYVLVADDQEMNLLLLKMILTRWKCRFDMATDGKNALELFYRNNYDMVLLDLNMPEMTGAEVMEHIRKDNDPKKAQVVALALTANITEEDIEIFKSAGFNGWLLKPFREKDIYAEIVKYIKA
ncbi:response regulator [Chitinophaga silvatica]|uniref:histidine kinase n=1 Tax=Chitinophaga silvatica TaxID=2282649 RepID=A0A3E1Y3V2_9BACT|nr:ATP-binding protein [Chitinophaga silvatica]RFS19364.1 response regulator [Chitinophaga silvatica]